MTRLRVGQDFGVPQGCSESRVSLGDVGCGTGLGVPPGAL